jgi:hypothetical protein
MFELEFEIARKRAKENARAKSGRSSEDAYL